MNARLQTWRDRSPRLTGLGRMVMVLGLMGMLLGVLLNTYPLLVLGLAAFALPLLALPLSVLNIFGIEYNREAPEIVQVREPFDIALELQNTKFWLGGFHFKIEESMKSRAHWRSFFSGLLPGQAEQQWKTIQLRKRGLVKAADYVVRSTFPLGLAASERTGVMESSTIVYPAPRMPRMLPGAIMQSGIESSGKAHMHDQGVGDFRSLRDYRPGDYAKLISWPVSSKRQELIAREMERLTPERISIVFHSFKPKGKVLAGWTFERALEIATGLFLHLHEKNIPFDFIADFNQWNRIKIWDGHNGLTPALTSLAVARITASSNLDPLVQTALYESQDARPLVIISNTPLRYWTSQIPALPNHVLCLDHTQTVLSLQGGVPHEVSASGH